MMSSLWLEGPAYPYRRVTPKAPQQQRCHLGQSPETIWSMDREAPEALGGKERSTHRSLQQNWISCDGTTTWRMSYKMQVMMSASVCISLLALLHLSLMITQVIPGNYPVTAMDLPAPT